MYVWIVCEGEGLPLKENERLWRMGRLADYLSKNGHKVLWWTSSFDHGSKKYLTNKTSIVKVNDSETLVLLHSPIAYKKNVSISRIIYHDILAYLFGKNNEKYEEPNIIICSWATQQFAKKSVLYGKRHKIPVIIDIRDEWPDYFIRVFPAYLKMIGKILLLPMHYDAVRTLKKADVIIGVIPSSVEWGLSLANRKMTQLDRTIYLANNRIKNDCLNQYVLEWWNSQNVRIDTWNICLIGTLSKQGDYDTLIQACKIISSCKEDFRLIIAGDGDEKKHLQDLANDCEQIIFPGWLNREQMESLLMISKCGAYSYKNSDGFQNAISNKVVQYFSAGLPVVSSLEGLSKEIITQYGAGIVYKEGDVEECRCAIEYLIDNDNQRKEMAKCSSKLFDELFDSERISEQFLDLFTDTIKECYGD